MCLITEQKESIILDEAITVYKIVKRIGDDATSIIYSN